MRAVFFSFAYLMGDFLIEKQSLLGDFEFWTKRFCLKQVSMAIKLADVNFNMKLNLEPLNQSICSNWFPKNSEQINSSNMIKQIKLGTALLIELSWWSNLIGFCF